MDSEILKYISYGDYFFLCNIDIRCWSEAQISQCIFAIKNYIPDFLVTSQDGKKDLYKNLKFLR